MSHVHDAVIVGAGFGGMGAAIQLRRMGYDDLLILEREDDLGGTWHVNRYPGLAVDIPSSTYSYSFEPNPHWSRLFAPGPGAQGLRRPRRRQVRPPPAHALRRRRRRRPVGRGRVRAGRSPSTDGTEERGRYLLTATGFLSQPRMPDIAGIEDFAGDVIHTTRWDDDVELEGKRIGIIGTGATAVQLIPEARRRWPATSPSTNARRST